MGPQGLEIRVRAKKRIKIRTESDPKVNLSKLEGRPTGEEKGKDCEKTGYCPGRGDRFNSGIDHLYSIFCRCRQIPT